MLKSYQKYWSSKIFQKGKRIMKKITLIIAALLVVSLLVPVGADKPGRISEQGRRGDPFCGWDYCPKCGGLFSTEFLPEYHVHQFKCIDCGWSYYIPEAIIQKENQAGRISQLEARVKSLEAQVEILEIETSNLESFVNFILSGDFAEMVCKSCQ